MENSTFITDSEITEYLNQELAELWSRLIQGQGQPFYRSSSSITVTSGTALYNLPSDFFEVQEVIATIGGVSGPLRPFMASEHGYLVNGGAVTLLPGFAVRYRIQANQIEFVPSSQSFTAILYYSPTQPRLSAGGDTFDGFAGFEMAAIYGTVATMLAKEESDPSFYVGQKERIYRHIDSLASQRDASAPERVQDVSQDFGGWWP